LLTSLFEWNENSFDHEVELFHSNHTGCRVVKEARQSDSIFFIPAYVRPLRSLPVLSSDCPANGCAPLFFFSDFGEMEGVRRVMGCALEPAMDE
jgi:hypothetical protein